MSEKDPIRAGKNHGEPGERLAGLTLLLIFGLLAAGIVTAGYLAYRNDEQHYRDEVARQLSSIAELKVSELTQWRKERLADGDILFKNAAFVALARQFLEKPADAEVQRQVSDWMVKLSRYGQYDRVWLLDPQGVTRLSVPGGQRPSATAILRQVSEVLRSGQARFQDFYRNEHDQHVYLAVLVPICDDSAANRPLGVLVLRIDPSTYLYPFIKRWPIPSLSAETLLVRRDGNDAVFLNELRFQANTALNLRVPLDRVTRPAVQAVIGQKGVVNGIDYRGVPVVAALRSVPASPWSLVARMDETEAYGPLRERLWMMSVIVAALLFGAGAGVGMVWRHQRVGFYRERAKATEALAASELRYRRFFEATRDGVLILDATTGMILDVNPFLMELLGCSHEALLGKKVWELGFFKDLIANEHNFAELQRKGYLRYEDMAMETNDGRRIEVEFTSRVYLVDQQKVLQCNLRDISARKQAEDNLQREREFGRALLENIADGVVACDAAGKLVLFNRVAREWHGMDALALPPEEWGRHYDLYGPDGTTPLPSAAIPLRRAFRGETVGNAEMTIVAKGQPPRHILASGCPFFDARHHLLGAVAVMRDITASRRAEQALEKTAADLERSNQELEQFAYVASHDLQEPLRMVASYTQLLAKRYKDQLDQDAQEFIRYAVDGAGRMQRLINDLLTYSRVQTQGKSFGPVDAHSALGEALANLASAIADSGAMVTNDDLPMVKADHTQLVQLFQNLISNALKFHGEPRPHVHVSVERETADAAPASGPCRPPSTVWSFSVRDNGIGIEPPYFERIFIVFQRLHGQAKYPGTGIGLAICKRIVERHGGRIWVESEIGKGASFHFTLSGVECSVNNAARPIRAANEATVGSESDRSKNIPLLLGDCNLGDPSLTFRARTSKH